MDCVNVFKITAEILMKPAVRSVYYIQNVQETKLVSETSVEIHARELVDRMLSAMWSTIYLLVHVRRPLLEILFHFVDPYQQVRSEFKK